jgi:hypothetical protein
MEEQSLINIYQGSTSFLQHRIIVHSFQIHTLFCLENFDQVQCENISFNFINKRKIVLLAMLVLVNLLLEQDWSGKQTVLLGSLCLPAGAITHVEDVFMLDQRFQFLWPLYLLVDLAFKF